MIVRYKAEVVVAVEVYGGDQAAPKPAAVADYLKDAASVDINTEEHGVLPDDEADVVGIEINWDTLKELE